MHPVPGSASLPASPFAASASLQTSSRARAVAKQHAGAAVPPVEQAREDLGSHDESAPALTARHELVGDRGGVQKAGAGSLYVAKAAPWVTPSFRCSRQAVDGKIMSGVLEASTIRSISSAASTSTPDVGNQTRHGVRGDEQPHRDEEQAEQLA